MDRVSDILHDCPACGHAAQLWEEEYYGASVPRYWVECPKCGTRTEYKKFPRTAVGKWNARDVHERRKPEDLMDNDRLMDMMGQVMAATFEDYQKYASRENPTAADIVQIRDIEKFVYDNPYMLPYNREYLIQEMRKQAKKARKKQAS